MTQAAGQVPPQTEASATAILLISCPDQTGIVAAVAGFITENRGNIIHLDQHVDSGDSAFFMRVEWEVDSFAIARTRLEDSIRPLAERFGMDWSLHFSDVVPRVALFVTKENHCLYDLLSRHESSELQMAIPLIVSNREHLRGVAERFGIDFHHFPITTGTKIDQEQRELDLLAEHQIDTVVLARYMQILSDRFVDTLPNRVINIHHSFLPAFPGARPYHSAHDRGVKIIGATSHYVTAELDEGPIIAQDVTEVSHRESVADFIRKGRDLEKNVLADAVWHHINRRILVYRNRTVVFG